MSKSDEIEIEAIESEQTDEDAGPVEYEIASYPADFTLKGLYEKWQAKNMLLPPFQRQFVWTLKQSSRLVESFLLGLPVPAVFLYKERTSQKFLVIDGQQRLLSVFFFFSGKFPGDRIFRLKDLRTHWDQKTFDELSEPDKLKLEDAVLRATIVSQLDPKDDSSIYHVFERLNTGSVQLTNQEVRNCVYWGKFNELMKELNNMSAWRELLSKTGLDPRQKDIELILRCLALHYEFDKYEKPMKEFLNKFMGRHRDPSDDSLLQIKALFTETCTRIPQTLGSKPFHIKAGLNTAVLDAVFVAFAANIASTPSDIAERYDSLKANKDFNDAVSAGTTDVDTVKKRIELAKKYLFS